MTIQWFPGHMQETELFLKKAVSNVDVVMEILDARLPISSSNPLIDQVCKNVLRIKVLNKQDLADPVITSLWLQYFSSLSCSKTNQHKSVNEKKLDSKFHKKNCAIKDYAVYATAISSTDSFDTWRALEFAISKFSISALKQSKSITKSQTNRRLRVMVAGIPNTGKSTLMNTLAGKKVAKTGNIPAITKHQQRTSLKNRVDIYDTPGVLPPILGNEESAFRLAASGAISDTAIDYSEIAMFVLNYLMEKYSDAIKSRYGIQNNIDDRLEILKKIGSNRGCIKKGGIVDLQKSSELLIRELRAGKIGRISLESPEDFS